MKSGSSLYVDEKAVAQKCGMRRVTKIKIDAKAYFRASSDFKRSLSFDDPRAFLTYLRFHISTLQLIWALAMASIPPVIFSIYLITKPFWILNSIPNAEEETDLQILMTPYTKLLFDI